MRERRIFRRDALGAARGFPGRAYAVAGSQGVGKVVPGGGGTALEVDGAAKSRFGLRGVPQGVLGVAQA
jgi:hypothetical protein